MKEKQKDKKLKKIFFDGRLIYLLGWLIYLLVIPFKKIRDGFLWLKTKRIRDYYSHLDYGGKKSELDPNGYPTHLSKEVKNV